MKRLKHDRYFDKLGYVRGVYCERGIVWQANITTSN